MARPFSNRATYGDAIVSRFTEIGIHKELKADFAAFKAQHGVFVKATAAVEKAEHTYDDAATRIGKLDVARDKLEERLVNRRTDKRTGQIYHLIYNPPPSEAELEHRDDDQPVAVAKRLDAYDAMTAALLPYYEERKLLRRIDGMGKPAEVTKRIFNTLNIDTTHGP